jgi:hypothetical protein
MEVFPVGVSKFLFWLGIVIMVVGVIVNTYTTIHVVAIRAVGDNIGASFIMSIVSPLWQGGILIGIAKILEKLQLKTN